MSKVRLHSPMEGLIDTFVDAQLVDYMQLRSTVTICLEKVEDSVRRQTALSLGRGWCSSLSGRPYKLYYLLAVRFGIPIFCLGRASEMVVSCRTLEERRELIAKFEALWNLGRNPKGQHWRDQHFRKHAVPGPAAGWTMIFMNRPTNVSVEGLIHTAGWDSIFDVVPRDATQAALSALLRKETLEVQINS